MILVLLTALAALVLLNGLFVAAEFALVKARKAQIDKLVEEGARGAAAARDQLDRLDEYLSACQLGITMASIGIGFLGEPAVASLLEEPLGVFGHAVATALSFAIAYLIVTALHITIGEQVPKIYAISRAESVTRLLAAPLTLFRRLFAPMIWALNAASNAMLRVVGVSGDALHEEAGSEELQVLIAQSASGGKLDPGEAGMLSGVFHLHEQQVRQVMTPIPAVVSVDIDSTVKEALERSAHSGHSRVLVCEDSGNVHGIVYASALARVLLDGGADDSINALIRPVPMVPASKPLDDLLEELQRRRAQLAVVLDEYGRAIGIVTAEDIVEEAVGEITDESDGRTAAVRQLESGDWYVRGEVSLADLDAHGLSLPVDSAAFNSVGGFVFAEIGRLPKRGDRVQANGYDLRVESVRDNRVAAVRVRERHDTKENDGQG